MKTTVIPVKLSNSELEDLLYEGDKHTVNGAVNWCLAVPIKIKVGDTEVQTEVPVRVEVKREDNW